MNYRSSSDVFTSFPSRTSMSTLIPACAASWPRDLSNLRMNERKKWFWKISRTFWLLHLGIKWYIVVIYLLCADVCIRRSSFIQFFQIKFGSEGIDVIVLICTRGRNGTRNEQGTAQKKWNRNHCFFPISNFSNVWKSPSERSHTFIANWLVLL